MVVSKKSRHSRDSVGVSVGLGVGFSVVAAVAVGYHLTRKRDRSPFSLAQWKKQVQQDGSIKQSDWQEIIQHISAKGMELDVRKEVWPIMLGVLNPTSSYQQQQADLLKYKAAYTNLIQICKDTDADIMAHLTQHHTPQLPVPLPDSLDATSTLSTGADPAAAPTINPYSGMLTAEDIPEELRQFYEAQRIIVMDAIRTDFKKHTLTTVEAITTWFSSAIADTRVYQHWTAQEAWWQDLWLSQLAKHQLDHAAHFSAEQKRQLLRLINLLSAYAVHDPETGYCQGMSDLALPFLLLFEDDTLAFWCFEHLMRKVRCNFAAEDSGIFSQLASLAVLLEALDPTLFYKLRQVRAADCHFAYRMIVVLMKRELSAEQTLRLWDMLWADDMLSALAGSSGAPSSDPAQDAPAGSSSLPDAQAAAAPGAAPVSGPTAAAGSTQASHSTAAGSAHEVSAERRAAAAAAGPQPPRSAADTAQRITGGTSSLGNTPDLVAGARGTQGQNQTGSSATVAGAGSKQEQQKLDLFMYFVAAVVISQRRRILDDCHDSDDVMRHFQSLKLDVADCMIRAKGYREKQQQGGPAEATGQGVEVAGVGMLQ